MPLDKRFTYKLLNWYTQNKRVLPWKRDKDVYKIWISEIILQQTRVEQGTPYYEKFILAFPTVHALADATIEQVLKRWEGLGYYSRARNLHSSAIYIVNELNGRFPDDLKGLLELKGIGPYSAAAIASFAYDLPHPVVDGNVVRFLARLLGIYSDKNAAQTHNELRKVLKPLIEYAEPSDFNQALMNFGSMVCSPKLTKCKICVFQLDCYAFANGKVNELPTKKPTKKKRNRFFTFLVWDRNGKVAIEQRGDEEIWKKLYQFPLFESTKKSFESFELITNDKVCVDPKEHSFIETKHVLSHQNLFIRFIKISPKNQPINNNNWIWVKEDNLVDYPFPIVLKNYIKQELLSQ